MSYENKQYYNVFKWTLHAPGTSNTKSSSQNIKKSNNSNVVTTSQTKKFGIKPNDTIKNNSMHKSNFGIRQKEKIFVPNKGVYLVRVTKPITNNIKPTRQHYNMFNTASSKTTKKPLHDSNSSILSSDIYVESVKNHKPKNHYNLLKNGCTIS